MTVNVCGIPYKVVERDDYFEHERVNLGLVDYASQEIYINKIASEMMKQSTLYHEVVHAMLFLMGYNELNEDEHFVQSMANALFQTFELKNVDEVK